jgi:hypothetical protein
MTDARDPASLIEAAQKAVGDGDYAEAERLLREAASVQESTLGSSHPDLATTLNNLAFVCERLDKFDEAERGYRRAHAIAVASLSPGHPFIKTSLTNLVEFCAARGIPIWTPKAAPKEEAELDVEPEVEREPEPEPEVEPAPVVAGSRLMPRALAAGALGVVAIAMVLYARQGQGTTEPPRAVAQVRQESSPSPVPRPAPSVAPSPASSPPSSPARESPKPRPDVSKGPVTVLTAQLCSALERRGSPDWQCSEARGDLRPGTYTFYTRLLTTEETRVEHRWYLSDRVHQVMRLRVPASGASGYRTFTSNTVIPERVGDWKVELRTADGSLLHEERFVVR